MAWDVETRSLDQLANSECPCFIPLSSSAGLTGKICMPMHGKLVPDVGVFAQQAQEHAWGEVGVLRLAQDRGAGRQLSGVLQHVEQGVQTKTPDPFLFFLSRRNRNHAPISEKIREQGKEVGGIENGVRNHSAPAPASSALVLAISYPPITLRYSACRGTST